MHIKRVTATKYKRFSDLTIEIDTTSKLVVLCGPNGTGKSSLFDALKLWQDIQSAQAWAQDAEYHIKGPDVQPWADLTAVEFHEADQPAELRKRIYVRSAYRNDPEFSLAQIDRRGSVFDAPRPQRMIDNDARVSDNYQRMVGQSLAGLYGGAADEQNVRELRESYIAGLRDRLRSIFPDVTLLGLGDPLGGGTFRFSKADATDWPYKNLSGGEKAVFDLLLDLAVKGRDYDDTVFCIDEPEAHSNPRVQGLILDALLSFVSDRSQLWIATHSIGMLRRARDLQDQDGESVAFIDFEDADFDQPVTLRPIAVTRDFWHRTLEVALGDVAELVAPATVVLCEGRPAVGNTARGEFDARCFRAIFGDQFPDTDFLSVGNERDVQTDRLQLGQSIQALVAGTTVIRVVDRDRRSAQEVADLEASGVRVLGRRHLEAYLVDDAVLEALCQREGQDANIPAVLAAKQAAMTNSTQRGNDANDWKSAGGEIFTETRRILGLQGGGNSTEAFMADTLAPLVTPGLPVYDELRQDVFGPNPRRDLWAYALADES